MHVKYCHTEEDRKAVKTRRVGGTCEEWTRFQIYWGGRSRKGVEDARTLLISPQGLGEACSMCDALEGSARGQGA
jgi:hypothetical protein